MPTFYDRARQVINRSLAFTSGQKKILREIVESLSTVDVLNVTSTTSTTTINVFGAEKIELTLTTDTVISLEGGTDGQHITFIVRQDNTGGHLCTWDPSIEWHLGVDPTHSLPPNSSDVILFVVDSDGFYNGMVAAYNMSAP